jgi:outer membrane receptor protein involved in Fe transport
VATCLLALGLAVRPAAAAATEGGRIEGRVTNSDGAGLGGVTVAIAGTSISTLTDVEGRFVLRGVPLGSVSVTFALGSNTLTVENVQVGADTVTLERTVDWKEGYLEQITVYSAFRESQKLVEAPASVTVLTADTIAPEAATAQLPKVLASAVGVDLAQNGVFDFNVNIRGLNSTLNRRVLTLVDGRDPSSVLIGAQEWAAFALPMDEISRIEIVRGAGSALYGTNAFNGVIDITTREPRYAQGGQVEVTYGEIGTSRLEARQGGALPGNWFYRAQTSLGRTDDFYVARNITVEYPGLPKEAVAPPRDHTMFVNAGARVDHYEADSQLTLEGGWARADGNMFLTGAGRVQNLDADRPWFRTAFQRSQWLVSGYYDGRNAQMASLVPGTTIFDDSGKVNVEAERRFDYGDGRGRVVVGGTYRYERADTRDSNGFSTILRAVEAAHEEAAFGQVDHRLRDNLSFVMAARIDNSTLHGPEVSPKAGLVYALTPSHGLRFTYGHGFETGSFVHYFTHGAAAPPVDLSAVETALKPVIGNVPLNFGSVPVLALGNDQLGVERVDSYEGGYSGIFGRRVLFGVTYYFNHITNLITPLLPQVGTELGRINPAYGPYAPPSSLSPEQQAVVLRTLAAVLPPNLYAAMSNDLDGSPIFAAASYTNYDRVNLQGEEVSLRYFPSDRVIVDTGYAGLVFHPKEVVKEELISANAPSHRVTAGITYSAAKFSAALRYRWSDAFTWSGGLYRGPVPAANVVDITGRYKIARQTSVILNVANLFDDIHYEVFGGDYLRRRALLTLNQAW